MHNPFRSRSNPSKPRSSAPRPPPPAPPTASPAPARQSSIDDTSAPIPSQSTSLQQSRLTALSTLSTKLDGLKAGFTPPASLVFQPSPSSSGTPKLAFVPTNAPFLAYEDALVKLLTEIDGIQSEGDLVVRDTRKALVRRVEGELGALDRMRSEQWEAEMERRKSGGQKVEDTATARGGSMDSEDDD
ncbi:bcl-2 associated athanogene 3-like protein [Pseudohyphozyma bogoriensis]|nr:bcl-2 associated athanogene 3-like protein [Pseudohyphozyma bogoriensis]